MSKKERTMTSKQYYYVFIATSIIGALSIVAALYLGNSRLASVNKQTSILLAERDVARDKLSKLTTISAQAKEAEDFEKTVTAIIPKTKDQQNLIAEIIYKATSEAEIAGSQIASFNFSGSDNDSLNDLSGTTPLESTPGVFEYPFSMAVNTISYSQLLKLLSEIESNQRLIQVSTVNITPSSVSPNSLDVTLIMKAYVQP